MAETPIGQTGQHSGQAQPKLSDRPLPIPDPNLTKTFRDANNVGNGASAGSGAPRPRVEAASKAAAQTLADTPVGKDKPKKLEPATYKQQVDAEAAKLAEATGAAQVLLASINMMVGAVAGPDAPMNAGEQAFIEPPLTRIINRLPVSAIDRFGGLMDPCILGIGMLFWFTRVRGTIAEKRAEKVNMGHVAPAERERSMKANTPPPAPSNGANGELRPEVANVLLRS